MDQDLDPIHVAVVIVIVAKSSHVADVVCLAVDAAARRRDASSVK